MKPKELKKWDKQYLWHPFTQMQGYSTEDPVIIERGEGSWLIDIDGRRYLDGVSSLWVTLHGHHHPVLDKALHEQIEKIAHSTLLGLANVPAVVCAQLLIEMTPPPLTRVFYSDSGSTAVEIALKMAFQYWQQQGKKKKVRFLHFDHSYHGDTIGSVSVGGIELFHARYRPLLFDAIKAPLHVGQACALIAQHAQELAAVIIEPMIQGAAGLLLQPPGLLQAMRQVCDEYEVLLIFDEVATGFGRTGKMLALEHEQVFPDLLCLAKGLTGGYLPLAATLATDPIYTTFLGEFAELKTFFHGHTYTGNPLACAVAAANIRLFKEDKTLEKLQPKIERLKSGLQRFVDHPHVKEVRQLGFMVGIELVQDKSRGENYPLEKRMGHRVILAARQRGLILRPLGDVIVLMPPLSLTSEELDFLLKVTYESIVAVTE